MNNDDERDYTEEQYNRYLMRDDDGLVVAVRSYCDYCEREGHTFRTCPARDDHAEDVAS